MALVGGPMYDGLYAHLGLLDDPGVEVAVHADHPTLNRRVAELLAAGERLDVVSTHSKYAPSQRQWLTPLDQLLPRSVLAALAELPVQLCTFDGHLLSVPRNVDVRTLWVRTDLVDRAPVTWDDLLASPHPFGFTGRESGLFGTFFEIVTALGGSLFAEEDGRLAPTLDTPEAHLAAAALVALARRGPAALPDWHYDDVDAALPGGEVPMAATWPGGFGRLRTSPVYDRLAPHPYLADATGRIRSYSGCHSWAVPTTTGDAGAAVELVTRLSLLDAHRADAMSGTIPARSDALAAVEPLDRTDAARLDVLRRTVAEGMITYPAEPRFPLVEDAGWGALHECLKGRLGVPEAVQTMQAAAEAALR